MTNEEYTPSFFDVREIYISAQLRARGLSMGTIDSQLSWEFDRFLVEVEAKATALEQERNIDSLQREYIEGIASENKRIMKSLQDKIKWYKRNGSVDNETDMGILIGLDIATEIVEGKDND